MKHDCSCVLIINMKTGGDLNVKASEVLVYLLVGVLLLQHDGQPLQEGPHAGRHVQADHALLLQSRAASGQHMVGCHELIGAVHNQHILEMKPYEHTHTHTHTRKRPDNK